MSGYRDTGSYLPPQQRDKPLTRLQWVMLAVAIVMASLFIFLAFAGDRGAPALGLSARDVTTLRALIPLWAMFGIVGNLTATRSEDPATQARRRKWLVALAAFVFIMTIGIIALVLVRP